MDKNNHIDWYLLLLVTLLILMSLAFVYSASASYAAVKFGSSSKLFVNHFVRVCLGIFAIILFAKIDYHYITRFSKYFMIIALILLIFVLVIGTSEKGAARWISLGFISFQPSEFAKLALILHLSVLLFRKQEIIEDFQKSVVPILIWSGLTGFLIVIQPDLSSAIIIFLITLVLMFVGNVKLLHVGSIGTIGMGFATILVIVKSDYRLNRVIAFIQGNSDEASKLDSYSYQLQQSLIAFGNGGFFGLGPGRSRQSDLFLPESYGDFIFSIVGEEYGFFGAMIIINLFLLIFWRGMIIAKNAPDKIGSYLAIGISFSIFLSVFVNAGVNTGILPTTGLPMPFISYGGTAIFFYSIAVGILLNISSQAGVFPRNENLIS